MIYVTGDTHGEAVRFDSSRTRYLKTGDTVIVCGDFGFIWDGSAKEEKILKRLGKKRYTLLFLDGAHENYSLLKKYPVTEWSGGKVQQISGNLYHLMRGQIYNIENKKIFTFGGGESAEKQMYIDAEKWWPEEMPTLEEMKEALANLKVHAFQVDYILTHQPPTELVRKEKTEGRSQLEAFFEQIAKQVKHEKWFFGSLHIDRKFTYKNIAVFNQLVPVSEPEGRKKRFAK